jgi:cytochrome P450
MSPLGRADDHRRRNVHTPDRIARQIVLPEGHRDDAEHFEAYRWLRENNPLARVEVDGYDPVWLVAKHADIAEIGRQPTVFTRSLTGGSLRVLETLVYLDPPEHTAVRAIAGEWFRPVNLAKWEGVIRDLVQQLAIHYPLHVIMILFGVPDSDEPRMMTLTQDLFGTNDPDAQRADVEPLSPTAAAEQWNATIQDFYAYFDDLVEARRAHPRDDLATIIAGARTDRDDFYPTEVAYGWFIAIATAGHDTTSSTLAGGLEALARHPDLLRRVQDDPGLIPNLVNESLRWSRRSNTSCAAPPRTTSCATGRSARATG